MTGFYNGVEVYFTYAAQVLSNTISNIVNDGVQAGYANNIHIIGNTISQYGDDGIQVAYSNGVLPNEPQALVQEGGEGEGNGDGGETPLPPSNHIDNTDGYIVIADNTITGGLNSGTTGEGGGDQPEREQVINGGGTTTGIRLGDNEGDFGGEKNIGFGDTTDMSGVGNVIIRNNDIVNNDVGLDARAWNNGYVDIDTNRFTNNTIGMWIGSGLIDLTHSNTGIDPSGNVVETGNIITGGSIGKKFEPTMSSNFYPAPEFAISNIEGPSASTPASLTLVGDTLGHTVFNGQTTYYVDLENGAFYNPGTPTIIDGTQATWDGVPGGLMSPSQLLAINAKIHDWHDDQSLGLIFPGYADLNDNLILQKVLGRNYATRKGSVTVLGLPHIGPFLGGEKEHFFSLKDLADIAPAAGGNDNGQGNGKDLTPAELGQIAPAAGGSNDNLVDSGKLANATCWGAVGGSKTVSIDLSDESSAILSANAACK